MVYHVVLSNFARRILPIIFLDKLSYYLTVLVVLTCISSNVNPAGCCCFSTSLIVLIQVYNWEIRHHSLVCCCGLADILYIVLYSTAKAF